MNNWLKISEKERIEILDKLQITTGLPNVSIEKDWWVTMTLRALFACECANHIVFKGVKLGI